MTIKSLLVKIGADATELRAELGKAQSYIETHAKQIRQVGMAMTSAGAIMTAFFAKAVEGAAAQEKAEAKLLNALQNVKGARVEGGKALIEQAAALQALTGYEDEQIINAQAMLATFQLTDEQIKQITPRLLDMAAATEKASGEQADLQAIAIALGKGFTGQMGSLARYGVVLSEQTKATGDFGAILHDLDMNFKGASETIGQTFAGQWRIAKVAIGDIIEQIGSKLLPVLIPLIQKIADVATKVTSWMQAHEGLTRVLIPAAAILGGLMTILGPIVMILPTLAAGFSMLTGPVGVAVAAIAGLIAIGTLIVTHWTEIKEFLTTTWNTIKTTATTVWSAIINFFSTCWEKIKSIFSTSYEALMTSFSAFGSALWEIIQGIVQGIVDKFMWLFDKVKEIMTWIKDHTVGVFKNMWDKVSGHSIVPEMVTSVINNFFRMRAGIGEVMDDISTKTKSVFGCVADYADAMKTSAASSFDSLAGSLRNSIRSMINLLEKNAIAYIVTKVMAALPFPLNLAAVAGAIAAVKALFATIKLAEGGIVTRPTLAMVGERGPEAVIPLNRAGALTAGGVTLRQNNYFYGAISNAGDIDEISRRLAERTLQAISKGRR